MTKLKLIDVLIRSSTGMIEIILATVLFTFGVYVGSPALHEIPLGSAELLTAGGHRWYMAAVYLSLSLCMIIGVARNLRWLRSWGTFGAFLTYAYLTIFRLIEDGVFSVPWILTLACAIIAAICHLGVRFELWNPPSSR